MLTFTCRNTSNISFWLTKFFFFRRACGNGRGTDECLKHSYYTHINLAFSYCFGIIYIVLVLDLLFSVYFGIQA